MLVEKTIGLDRRSEFVVGPDKRQRGRRREQRGVGSRSEELVGILRKQKLAAGEGYDFDPPEAPCHLGFSQNCRDPGLKILLFRCFKRRRQQQAQSRGDQKA